MENQNENKISPDIELDEASAKGVFIIQGVEPKEQSSGKTEPDERFFVDEEEIVSEPEHKKTGTVFNKEMKKRMAKESRKAKREATLKSIKTGIMEGFYIVAFSKILDFLLNMFSIGAIIVSVFITIGYFLQKEIWLSLVGCALIVVFIYLQEKIS